MAYRMFAGELDGKLVLCHFGFRARDVRESVAKMFPGYQYVPSGWEAAKKFGWRVAPVMVSSQDEWLR